MLKQTLLAASLALLLTGQAYAGDPGKRGHDAPAASTVRADPESPPAKADDDRKRKDDRDRGKGHEPDRSGIRDRAQDQTRKAAPVVVRDWGDNNPREIDSRHDDWRDRDRDDRRDLAGRVWRAVDHRDDDGRRDHDWRDRDWRDNDWRDHDWRRDDDWRRRGWFYNGLRNDGWRYYRSHDNRHWRYCPPYRYSLDYGYRSGYERAWRDWLNYGRYDRYWRRGSFFGFGVGSLYRSGYDAGWRDAAYYYDRGYRPDYWGYDQQGGWYFSFRIEG
jgi:hypothetical protein